MASNQTSDASSTVASPSDGSRLDLNNPDVRRELLLDRLDCTGQLVSAELARTLDVSGDTIRRDLLALEADGLLRRVRGGALPIRAPSRPFRERKARPAPELDALALAAQGLIENGMCLLLDGGTSVLACTRALPSHYHLTIITPAPSIASLAHEMGHEVIQIGGRLTEAGGSAVGAETERAIERCTADLCLLGTCTISAGHGIGADDHDDAGVKRAMFDASRRVAVIAGASKFDLRGRYRVCDIGSIDVLVTDASSSQLQPFRAFTSLEICRTSTASS